MDAARYPELIVAVGHVAPSPRRVRGLLGGEVVFDTVRALYVWEIPPYPQYYVPLEDVDPALLARIGEGATVHGEDAAEGLAGTVRFQWDALDEWFEEDERVFVHPRNPYARVDALRSTRSVRVELDGVLLAESSAPVILFETGLPPRYYLDRGAIAWEHLVASETRTACPYKGRTSEYWSVRTAAGEHPDLAWSYAFPTRELTQIASLVCFFNEKVDISVDGRPQERPHTPFS